jgi:hypothetical protein
VPADATSADVEVQAAADAAVGRHDVSITATGPDGLPGAKTPPKAFSRLGLTVKAVTVPPSLRLSVSPEVVVDQTGKNRFFVVIARDNFRGPVTVELGRLPRGVTAPRPLVIPAESTSGLIQLEAAADAAVGQLGVTVTATGPALPGGSDGSTKARTCQHAAGPTGRKVASMRSPWPRARIFVRTQAVC